MKNLLYISPLPHIGGGEISLLTLIKNLNNEIFNLSIICYSEGPFVEKAKKMGIKVTIFSRTSFFSNLSIIWKIFRYIRKNNIHLVHVNCLDIRAGIVAWLAGVPFIGHLRVIFPFTWRDYLFVRLSKKVIAVSNAVIDVFCRKKSALRWKFIMIPNPVEVSENIVVAPLKKEYNLPKNVKLVGTVGRIDLYKGYEYFIKAANIIINKREDVYFFIVGGITRGDIEGQKYFEMLKVEIDKLKLNNHCFFTGFRENVLEMIKAFDVLIVPSVVIKKNGGLITEGFGRVAIEAMALEVPVIVSDIGGLKEIVENDISGFLVPTENPEAIAETILLILSDKAKAKAVIEAGSRRVEKLFTVEKHIKAVENLYKEILIE